MKSIRTTLIICMLMPIIIAFSLMGGTLVFYMDTLSVSDGNKLMPEGASQTAESVDGILELVQSQVDLLANTCSMMTLPNMKSR